MSHGDANGDEASGGSAPPGVPDLVGPGLKVVFCGINPGTLSGETGYHFARPGNRFWPALHGAGFTDRRFDPSEQEQLVALGVGITNLVSRTTAAASDVDPAELRAGAERLTALAQRWAPRAVAVLGVLAYRRAFRRPHAAIGRQDDRLGPSQLWVLPNPSGLQARYQLPELTEMFSVLRSACER
ncbi:G/U mismatch-specific DNA glycosylase [Acidiferrimicrobium sp. IK]|uniref:G/U mismatch-specific DNA glycosylase n=1 Tax=Acidiferrimicrobium sp. IK TaxID=2871700 RepID=UPI0039673970